MKAFVGGAALIALMAATAAVAQDAPPPGGQPPAGGDRPPPPPITRAEFMAEVQKRFAEADLNHDGKVTRGELVDARDARLRERMKDHRDRRFTAMDANHDGMLSRGEFDDGHPHGTPPTDGKGPPPPGHPMGPRGMGMMPVDRVFAMAEMKGDGTITLAQAQAAAAAWFDRLDVNHDGTITTDERRMAVAKMAHRRWPGGPDGPGGPDRGGSGDGPGAGVPPPQQ